MKTIIDMAIGLVLKDVPENPPTLDSCPPCAFTKRNAFRSKLGAHTLEPLELVHGDLLVPCLSNKSVVANTVSHQWTMTRVRVRYCP